MLAPSFLGLFIVGASALPHDLYSRSSVDVKILTQTDGQFEACSTEKIAFINSYVADCVKQAKDASTALKQADVTKAPSFTDFLPTNVEPATIASEHYDPIVSGVPATLGSTTTVGTGAKDLTFICPTKCKTADYFAFAINKGGENSQFTDTVPGNIVMACPAFFGTDQDTGDAKANAVPRSLTAAAQLYTSGQRLGNVPSMTLLHEFQHLELFVGAANVFPDVKVNKKPAYNKDVCKGLSNADRAKNAQNFGWFAFEAAADPARAKACPPAPAPAPPTANVPARPGTPLPVKAANSPTTPKAKTKAPVKARVLAKAPVTATASCPARNLKTGDISFSFVEFDG
ncbi:hypothetical protein B0H19DRAFT_1276917 [Mycena capillaripes]|nr:hypothetical protein B0H19DRAFT_1276917 [Mycena capillaripes]